MQLGVTFPQIEIGSNPAGIREYAQTVEAMGFRHLVAYDHVLGAKRDEWHGPYSNETPFHEIFVLLSHLAAVTAALELVTGVLVLPQRPTALAAKQAAALDILSGGRLRLGVGVGYDPVEFAGLGASFTDRGARCNEQVELLRRLWTEPVISFQSDWHTFTEAGINPLPTRRIPIWIGGEADVAYRRAARLADGFFPIGPPDDKMAAQLDKLRGYLEDEGRDPATFGIEARMSVGDGDPAKWQADVEAWRQLGATHINFNTMWAGLSGAQEHLEALARAAEALDVAPESAVS